MAAAMAGLPYTAACSPRTITLPGAETMDGNSIGDKSVVSMAVEMG